MNADTIRNMEQQISHLQAQLNEAKRQTPVETIKTVPDTDPELNQGVAQLHQLAAEYDDLIISARSKYLEFLAELQRVDSRYQAVGNHRRSLLHAAHYQLSDRAFQQAPYLRLNQDSTITALDLQIAVKEIEKEAAIRRMTHAG